MKRLLIVILFSIFLSISSVSYLYSYASASKKNTVVKTEKQKANPHSRWVEIILLIGLIFVVMPYVFPFVASNLLGGYKSGWDSTLGGCFGGILGGGFGGFLGGSKDAGW